MDVGRDAQDRELGRGARRIREMRRAAAAAARRARARAARRVSGLAERRVVVGDAGAREQLGDDGFVHVGVLPQIEHREVKSGTLRRRA